MTSLDKAKNPSASSEGPEDFAVEHAEQDRIDTPAGGASSPSAQPSTGDARLHLQNAHFGALQVQETREAPLTEKPLAPTGAPHENNFVEPAGVPRVDEASPEASPLH
ncbi:MAG: hypothetical protein HOP13_17500, partial [Alphaproteobacteria bacterium]|nr:hypothetical protein [Alphaproteobacteria bacterium]